MLLLKSDKQVHYDYSLARFYMWAQTDVSVHIAVQVATGKSSCKTVETACFGVAVQPPIHILYAADWTPTGPPSKGV